MQQYYEFLISLEEKLCEWLVEGAKLNEVYDKAVAMVKKEHPDLVDKLTKNFGFLMGIEFREPSLSIAPNCTATLKKGMVFNLNVGLSGITNNQVRTFRHLYCTMTRKYFETCVLIYARLLFH